MEIISYEDKQFCTKSISGLLSYSGFYEPCLKAVKDGEQVTGTGFSFTNNGNTHEYTIPLWQQVIDWFRIKHNIHVYLMPERPVRTKPETKIRYSALVISMIYGVHNVCKDEEYEAAREKGILKALTLIKR